MKKKITKKKRWKEDALPGKQGSSPTSFLFPSTVVSASGSGPQSRLTPKSLSRLEGAEPPLKLGLLLSVSRGGSSTVGHQKYYEKEARVVVKTDVIEIEGDEEMMMGAEQVCGSSDSLVPPFALAGLCMLSCLYPSFCQHKERL
uniref:Uncharacterized protein n=1 Tax=Leersia perrieri TaxID=77586 RepID=A0A0D9XP79_9ORYZ